MLVAGEDAQRGSMFPSAGGANGFPTCGSNLVNYSKRYLLYNNKGITIFMPLASAIPLLKISTKEITS